MSDIQLFKAKGELAPTNFQQAMEFAKFIAGSAMVPKQFRDRPADILLAIQWGTEVGLAPLQALQNIAVINGKPSLYGDSMLALVQGSGALEMIHESIENSVATCRIKRKGQPETVRTFSEADAKKAKLWDKDGPWKQYPQRMMQMRARSWALRDLFPDVLMGVYSAEEAEDIPPEPYRPERPTTPPAPQAEQVFEAEIVQEPEPASKEQRLFITELLKALKMSRAQADEMISRRYKGQTWVTLTADDAENLALELHERVSIIEDEKSTERLQQGVSR